MTPQDYLERLAGYAAARGRLIEYRGEGLGGNSPSRASDCEWIAANPNRRHRLRPLLEDETGAPGSLVIVRCIPWQRRDGAVVEWVFIKAALPSHHTPPADNEKMLEATLDEYLVASLRKPWEKVSIPACLTIPQDDCAILSDSGPDCWVTL